MSKFDELRKGDYLWSNNKEYKAVFQVRQTDVDSYHYQMMSSVCKLRMGVGLGWLRWMRTRVQVGVNSIIWACVKPSVSLLVKRAVQYVALIYQTDF